MNLPEELAAILQLRQRNHSQLTLVTGVFDVLHHEHRQFLLAAKQIGQILLIGLESDQRVTAVKGQGRPINDEHSRQKNLIAWNIADLVFILPPSFGQAALRKAWLEVIRPDYLAVSSHTPFLAVKRQEIKAVGGQLKIVHQFNPQVSSSKLIDKKNRQTQIIDNSKNTKNNTKKVKKE